MAAPNSGPSPYFPFPYSLQPLGNELRLGLIGPGLLGLLSVASTSTLLAFILYRFFAWRKHYRTYIGYNQYVVLIMNLLIADLQQGSSFLISFHWIRKDAMLAPSQACFAQGWLLNLGDVASGFFVFFIAMHTFYTAVKGRRVQYATFASLIIFTWVFSLALTAAGPLTHRADYFVRAGAWCWASSKYERDRLAYHYIWVFVIEFGTIIIYVLTFLRLRSAVSSLLPSAAQTATYAKIDRAAKLMILYPITYIILTLPLSAGRMWSMAHGGANLPNSYSLVAGTLLASSGLIDTLLYTLTRRALLSMSGPDGVPHSEGTVNKGWFKKSGTPHSDSSGSKSENGGITQTRTVTVTGRRASIATPVRDPDEIDFVTRPYPKIYKSMERRDRTGSMDAIIERDPMPLHNQTIVEALSSSPPRSANEGYLGRKPSTTEKGYEMSTVRFEAREVDSESSSDIEYDTTPGRKSRRNYYKE